MNKYVKEKWNIALVYTEFSELQTRRYASVNSTCAQPPPPGNCGAFAHLVCPGGGAFANVALPGGRASANPRGQSRAFDTHLVSYQNITTKKVLLEEKQIGSSVKDRNKL